MLETIREIIYQVTGKKNITLDTDFMKDLELTSFDIMNVVCAFEQRFDVSIPTRDVWQLRRVKDVLEYMQKRGLTDEDCK